jgi:hypothetical protein
MHNSSNKQDYRALCLDVGMDCASCVKSTAGEAAKVCPGLKGRAIQQLFVLLYPNSACAPMHGRFAQEYHRSPGLLERKPPAAAKPRLNTAVA